MPNLVIPSQHRAFRLKATRLAAEIETEIEVETEDQALLDTETADDRRRALSFSSSEPAERMVLIDGQLITVNETLSHAAGAVDLSRLNDGASLLFNHCADNLRGVVEPGSAVIESGIGRAVVRFSKSEEGTEALQEVDDGILTKVSIGYDIIDYSFDPKTRALDVKKWRPYEISLVTIPVDASVGVGRANPQTSGVIYMHEENIKPNPPPPGQSSDASTIAMHERIRISEIMALCRSHHVDPARVDDFIKSGKSIDECRAKILDIVTERSRTNPGIDATHLDLSPADLKRYSLFRAIRATADRDWRDAGFELECSRAISDRLGRAPKGFFVPYDWQVKGKSGEQRALSGNQSVTVDTAGGYLVGTQHMAGSFIDNLRARAVLTRAGAYMMTDLVGDVDIPKKTGSGTFYWVPEAGNITQSNLTFGSVNMRPRTAGAGVGITRKLLKQSSPDVEGLVRSDLELGASLAIDLAGLNGAGAPDPLGIFNTTGINTNAISTDASPTWAEMVAFETEVNSDNALSGSLNYITTPAIAGHCKTTPKVSAQAIFIMENNQINGYPVLTTTQMPTSGILFGNFSDVIIGSWGVLDVNVDTATNAAAGGLILWVFIDVDIAVRHAESFCKGT